MKPASISLLLRKDRIRLLQKTLHQLGLTGHRSIDHDDKLLDPHGLPRLLRLNERHVSIHLKPIMIKNIIKRIRIDLRLLPQNTELAQKSSIIVPPAVLHLKLIIERPGILRSLLRKSLHLRLHPLADILPLILHPRTSLRRNILPQTMVIHTKLPHELILTKRKFPQKPPIHPLRRHHPKVLLQPLINQKPLRRFALMHSRLIKPVDDILRRDITGQAPPRIFLPPHGKCRGFPLINIAAVPGHRQIFGISLRPDRHILIPIRCPTPRQILLRPDKQMTEQTMDQNMHVQPIDPPPVLTEQLRNTFLIKKQNLPIRPRRDHPIIRCEFKMKEPRPQKPHLHIQLIPGIGENISAKL